MLLISVICGEFLMVLFALLIDCVDDQRIGKWVREEEFRVLHGDIIFLSALLQVAITVARVCQMVSAETH